MLVEFSETALKRFKKLDCSIQTKIKKWKIEIETLENPRSRGKPLTQNLKGYWRYRIENYRLICDIQDEKLVILVLLIGHRSNIYD
jgi:mRNA interferase RelE/StbE